MPKHPILKSKLIPRVRPATDVRALNPPAFPVGRHNDTKGATLRDLFAAFAPDVPEWFEPARKADHNAQMARFCRWRFLYAERMLEERARLV